MLCSGSMLGFALPPLLLLYEEFGFVPGGCCTMGLTAAMLAAPYLSRYAGRSGRGAGVVLCELSIKEEKPRPSRQTIGSSIEVDE